MAKLTVKVCRASGHGPHGLFPSETARVVVEVPGASPAQRITRSGTRDKAALAFGDELQFELGAGCTEVRVALHGQLPDNCDDPVGSGSCSLTRVFGSPRDARRQEVRVPLEAPNGSKKGEVELTLAVNE